jgi:hypothetical protein
VESGHPANGSTYPPCIGTWKDPKVAPRYRIGIRWNSRGKTIGNPTSHGKPTWYLLPHELVGAVLKSTPIPGDKLQLAETLLKSQRELDDKEAA